MSSKEYMREYLKAYRLKNRERLNKQHNERNKDRKSVLRANYRIWYRKLKLAAIEAYGGSKCQLCPETRTNTLTIDHINGGGAEHRRIIGVGTEFYRWLKRNNYPEGYRVLCMNCNHLEYLKIINSQIKSTFVSARSKRKRAKEIKSEVMVKLGGKCAICQLTNLDVLTVHHRNGEGNKERLIISNGDGGVKFYRYMLQLQNLFEYECLCFSCNCGEDWISL